MFDNTCRDVKQGLKARRLSGKRLNSRCGQLIRRGTYRTMNWIVGDNDGRRGIDNGWGLVVFKRCKRRGGRDGVLNSNKLHGRRNDMIIRFRV
jgi:hypothetical protein